MNTGEILVDKEYILLNEIEKNENITQRELSKKAELSLGSVNLLINKMVHEGLIKISQIPMNRVAYMLTPVGIAEKVRKTSDYIKIHYNYINEMVKKIKSVIIDLNKDYSTIIIVLEQDEISELVRLAVSELHCRHHIKMIQHTQLENINLSGNLIVVLGMKSFDLFAKRGIKVINLLERISL